MKVTIHNNFHHTQKTVILKSGCNDIKGRRLKEWKKALCCSDCVCSGDGGLRGDLDEPAMRKMDGTPIEWNVEHDNSTGYGFIRIWCE